MGGDKGKEKQEMGDKDGKKGSEKRDGGELMGDKDGKKGPEKRDGGELIRQNVPGQRKARIQGLDTSKRFRNGACLNCGGLNHTSKTCLDRPFARGAKYRDVIYPDDDHFAETSTRQRIGFDVKRDSWEKTDTEPTYIRTVKRFEARSLKVDDTDLKIRDGYVDKALDKVFINPRAREDIPKYLKKSSEGDDQEEDTKEKEDTKE